MSKPRRNAALTTLGVVAIASLYFFRTIELGRSDAKPAHLEILNPTGALAGPGGIRFDSHGTLYAGTSQGLIWVLEAGGNPRIFAQLDQVQSIPGLSLSSDPIMAGGMAFDRAGNLYVAAFDFAGGSVLRIDPDGRTIRFFAVGIGVANSLVVTGDDRHLWVSDCRSRGRLLRYPLGGSTPAQPDQVIPGLSRPSGLALGKDDRSLYAAETLSGDVVRADLTAAQPAPVRIANLKHRLAVGSLNGLAFDPRDPERRFLYVAENLRGLFTVLDLRAQPVRILKRISVAQMGDRPCPAFLVIHDGYLYFTDIWSCNPLRIVLGFPKYHQFVFRFKITDLSMVY